MALLSKKKKNTKAAEKKAEKKNGGVMAGAVELRPLMTEKSMQAQGKRSRVAFKVRPDANRSQIKAAVAETYGVVPAAVRTLNVMGKVRRRGRTEGRTRAWKKAYVTLPEGKNIDLTV